MSVTTARPVSLAQQALMAIGLSLVLYLSAKIQVPFWPVPMTLQTMVVLAVAGIGGPRVALMAIGAYLIQGAVGLPVFSGTPERGIGLAYMAGPTGGYLAGWLPAAALVGYFHRRSLPVVGLAMLAATAIIYLCGAAWLAGFVGTEKAIEAGVLPFLAGDAVKTALALALVAVARRA